MFSVFFFLAGAFNPSKCYSSRNLPLVQETCVNRQLKMKRAKHELLNETEEKREGIEKRREKKSRLHFLTFR